MHGVIYIVNAHAHNVTRDDDYSAAAYRALNATLSCVMFRQWLDFNSENPSYNAERNSLCVLSAICTMEIGHVSSSGLSSTINGLT